MNLRNLVLCVCTLALCTGAMSSSAAFPPGPGGIVWQDRVIPLPQEMDVPDVLELPAGAIRFEVDAGEPEALPLGTARELLAAFAAGDDSAQGLVISMLDRAAAAGRVPEALLERLATLPNADQAYLIVSEAGDTPRLTLVANTPVGLMYAARTLNQLVKPPSGIDADTRLTVPLVRIIDWPDIEQRGDWSAAGLELHWNAQWKLNMFKRGSHSRAEPDGTLATFAIGSPRLDPDRYRLWAESHGYILVPFIVHLEHISGGVWGGNWKGISVPVDHPTEPMRRPPHGPGFCWSDDVIQRVMVEHMRRMAQSIEGHGRDIEVWLSEGGDVSCWCDDCGGENGYVMETLGTLRAFEALRPEFPGLRLRITLSQGSAEVNDRIVAMLPPDVGLGYYHGHLSYPITREPIIDPLLEEFARAGGFLDVMPTSNHWGPAVPRTLPQYIQFRMQEFAEKQLRSITNFRQPDRHYFEFNVVAQGEWSWNANGRGPRDFARAFAVVTGIENPDLYAEWAMAAGEAGWELGYNTPFGQMHQGSFSRAPRFEDPDRFTQSYADARRAWDLAQQLDEPQTRIESEVTLAGFRAVELLDRIQTRMNQPDDPAALQAHLVEFDEWAHLVLANLDFWHRRATANKERTRLDPFPAGEYFEAYFQHSGLPHFVQSSGYAMLRASDSLWEAAALLGVEDTREGTLPVEIGEWMPEDFEAGEGFQSVDLTDHLSPEGGTVDFGLIFLEGDPVRVNTFNVFLIDPETDARTPLLAETYLRIGAHALSARVRTDKFNFAFDVPPLADGQRVVIEFRMRDGGDGSEGIVTLRPTWRREKFPAERLQRLRNATDVHAEGVRS